MRRPINGGKSGVSIQGLAKAPGQTAKSFGSRIVERGLKRLTRFVRSSGLLGAISHRLDFERLRVAILIRLASSMSRLVRT